jgi:ATPase family associated with various cellular activities (AAA)
MSTLEQQEAPVEPLSESRVESLGQALDRVYRAILGTTQFSGAEIPAPAEQGTSLLSNEPCFALERLESIFGLSPFERDLLVLCAGTGLERRFLAACAAAHQDAQATWPTFGLALSTLDKPHWSSISRARPLRYWRLIEVDSGSLLHAPLRIDEHVLQFLIGIPAVDERLQGLVRPLDLSFAANLANRSANLTDAINLAVSHWSRMPVAREPILLVSNHRSTRQAAFLEICRQIGLRPCSLHAADIPATPMEREQFARLWTRESVLSGAALCIQTDDSDNYRNLSVLLNQLETPVAVEVQPGSQPERLEGLRIHLAGMSAPDRKRIWTEHLGSAAQQMNGYLDRIVDHFQFDEPGIQISALTAREKIGKKEGSDAGQPPGQITWNICRQHARRSLENLAQRLEPHGAWNDLILPDQQIETLQQIVVHVRYRAIVNEHWGFAARHERGLGLSVLFSGTTGTGKTMAAEIIAAELDLDLYRIDLASVVSKYIGETEKNLRRIFDAAEESSAILLFDEADALFGKRSEVRDSHDRYANLEVSYLLQRIESYRGVAILTTNMQHALDSAFMRRIRFIVQFPFPDAGSRARIWQRIFPSATPIGPVDYERLAQLNVSGGVIRNIAMHAAFRAAEEQEPISMKHLFAASRTEYSKMDKPLTAAETRGWL